jgi:hypothetical protein
MLAGMLINLHHVNRAVAAALCVLMLAGPAIAQVGGTADARLAKLKQVALSIPHGSPVQVQLKDKTRLSGRIGAVDNDGFDLQFLDKGSIVSKKLAFEEVNKLSAGPPKTTFERVKTPILTVLGLVGTAGALTAAIKR